MHDPPNQNLTGHSFPTFTLNWNDDANLPDRPMDAGSKIEIDALGSATMGFNNI